MGQSAHAKLKSRIFLRGFPRVDRLTRKELKSDQVAEKAFTAMDWVNHHRSKVGLWAGIVVGLGLVWLGYHYYSTSQEGVRQEALSAALRLDEATTGTNINPAMAHFETPDEKTKAVAASFTSLAQKYPGTQEGSIAELYLAGTAAERGDFPEAEKRLKNVVDHGPEGYASMARVSLAQVYASENKQADAEKLLREAMNDPSATVSKESAQLTLAQLLSKSKPEEARKLLDPLRALPSRPAVVRAAITLGGEMSNQSGATGALEVPLPPAEKK